MTTFESKIKSIYHPQETIFRVLSDLNNIEYIKSRIPQGKVQDLTYDTDSVDITVDKVGRITLRIINREASKTIKFAAEGTPTEANMWIQLKEVAPNDTKMKITIKASLNPMLKIMLKGKVNDMIDMIADTLANIDYSNIGE